jgi:hypothetical protein
MQGILIGWRSSRILPAFAVSLVRALCIASLIGSLSQAQAPDKNLYLLRPILTAEQKIEVLALLWQQAQMQSMHWWSAYWSERYKAAQLLPEKEWVEFQRTEAPRALGDRKESYSEHYARRAREYEAQERTLSRKLKDLSTRACAGLQIAVGTSGIMGCT